MASLGWLRACSSKRVEFRRFTGTVRVTQSLGFSRMSRPSKARVGIRVNLRIRVSLVLVIVGIGFNDMK